MMNIKSGTSRHLLAGLVFAGLLTGCSGGKNFADIDTKMNEIQAKPKGSIQPPPEFKPAEQFAYSVNQKRSPFVLPENAVDELAGNMPNNDIQPDESRPKEYLERFNLDRLKMVGSISKPSTPLEALVADPDGNVTRVKLGSYMGTNYGKVVKISQESITLREIVPDGRNGWVERPKTIKLTIATNY